MATNIIYDRIFKGLKSVIGGSVVLGTDATTRKPEYFRLHLANSPEQVENFGSSITMLYTVNIDFNTNNSDNQKYLSQAISNALNSLNNNAYYVDGSTYHWHGGNVINSEYGNGDGFDSRIIWTCYHSELKGS